MYRKSKERETLGVYLANYTNIINSGTIRVTGRKDELKL